MCDTFVALPQATADGSVILGKNSDREPNEAHCIVVAPAADHAAGATVTATYRTIPQARRTHRVLLAKPYWIWGAEMGVNEHGVAIGNEAVFTKVKHESEPGLLGMDLLRLGLERGASAEEAADVIAAHLQAHGQSGQAGHTDKLQYHNSFIIADAREALVLETVGRDWVVERVRGTRSISNALTIDDGWESASPGFQHVQGSIAEQYSDFLYTRFSDAHARQCRTTDTLTALRGSIAPADAMALLRDHGEGVHRRTFTPADGLTGQTVCAHAGPGPIRISQSTGSMVAHLRPGAGATVWLTGTSAPCLSVFKPVWLDGGMAEVGPQPTGTYDPATLWWRHEDLHRAVLPDYAARAPLVQGAIAELEEEFLLLAAEVEDASQAHTELTRRCFADAADRLAPLLPSVAQHPVQRRAGRLYARAWRQWDRQAQR